VAGINAQRAQLEPAERPELFRRALEAAAGVPGVASAVLSAVTPVSGSTWNNRIELPDGPPLSERERVTFINLVSGGWFGTYGTPMIAGRALRGDAALRTGAARPAHGRRGRRGPRNDWGVGRMAAGASRIDPARVLRDG
jgi:hypothetical protein